MAFTINATSIKKPDADGLIEDYQNYETTQVAINGGKQRTRAGRKKVAKLKWTGLTPAQYQVLLGILDTGAAVAYVNSDHTNKPGSVFSFTGLPTFEAGNPYWRGTSMLVDASAVIEEV